MSDTFTLGFNVPFHQAIKEAQDRAVVLPEIYYNELRGIARVKSFSIAGITSLDTLTVVRDSLAAKLQSGQTFREWKKDILESGTLDLPNHRLENIFRTNIQGNYNRGRWDYFNRNQKAFPYLMYDAINDTRVRPSHLALDGVIRPVNDPFWATHAAPNGYMCRCSMINLTETQAAKRSNGDNGLNKPVDLEKMQPDKGWDYNPGKDMLKGVDQAIARREIIAPTPLFNAMKDTLAELTAASAGMIAAQQVIERNVTATTIDIIEVATLSELQAYRDKLKLLTPTYFVIDEIKRVDAKINEMKP
jgi:SPP1 gp7 family putative phage head morphogenesis protein